MRDLLEQGEAMLAAASFAEEGEVETARWVAAAADMDRKARAEAAARARPGKPVASMIVTGVLSLTLYAALLLYQDEVNAVFGRAGAYAVLPVLTAFLFSFIHGTFTGRFWTVLGIEASSKKGGARSHA